MAPINDPTFATLTLLAGGVALVINNWWRARVAAKSASRKEDRDQINDITELVDKVEADAYEYYALPRGDSRATELAARIKATLKQISRHVQRYCRKTANRSTFALTLSVRLRQAITSEDFDTAGRVQRGNKDPIYEDVTTAGRKLIDELERVFSAEYR